LVVVVLFPGAAEPRVAVHEKVVPGSEGTETEDDTDTEAVPVPWALVALGQAALAVPEPLTDSVRFAMTPEAPDTFEVTVPASEPVRLTLVPEN
jgi:hypothetical protein